MNSRPRIHPIDRAPRGARETFRAVALVLGLAALAVAPALALDDVAPPTVETPSEAPAESPGDASAAETDAATAEVADAVEASEEVERIHRHRDRFALGSAIRVPAGVTRHGDVAVVFGEVEVEGEVRGQVVVIGGRAKVSGRVHGDIVAIASELELAPDAEAGGLVSVLGSIDDAGARIYGEHVAIPLPVGLPGWKSPMRLLLTLWLVLVAVALILKFLGAVLAAALAPETVRTVAEAASRRWFVSTLVGVAVVFVGAPLATLLLLVSVIGGMLLPVLVVGLLVMGMLGNAGVFCAIGAAIGRRFGREFSLFGALATGFVVLAILQFVPLFGMLVGTVLGWTGIGALVVGGLERRRARREAERADAAAGTPATPATPPTPPTPAGTPRPASGATAGTPAPTSSGAPPRGSLPEHSGEPGPRSGSGGDPAPSASE